MIAILILGVGMIMVAATFPVGLEATRINTEQTLSPIIAKEAFAELRLLYDDMNIDTDLNATFRGAVKLSLLRPFDPFDMDKLFFYDQGKLESKDINDWLRDVGLRSYYATEDQYTWSTLLRSSPMHGMEIHCIIFVNRGSWGTPKAIQFGEENYSPTTSIIQTDTQLFSEGGFLVREDGFIFKINLIEIDYMTLNFHPQQHIGPFGHQFNAKDPVFWYMPKKDPSLGSPCIGVYSRLLCECL